MAPSRLCSASILCGALRKAGVPASGASLRTFESVMAIVCDVLRISGFCRMPVRGGDKALPLCNPKVRVGLMPDSHNAICESRGCLRIPLDGDWPEPASGGSSDRGAFHKMPH